MEDIILYDWLSFTSKQRDPRYLAELLGLQDLPWQITKGARGYQDRLYFNSISIHYNGREDMGIWCEMSGQGCRAFEDLTELPGKWNDLFSIITTLGLHITRLDVAYDDHTGTLDMNQIVQDTRNKEYVSKSDSWSILESNKGQTVVHGSEKSDTLIRIYDKARERNCAENIHWIRCELQLRRDRAASFVQLGLPIGEAYCGVVMNYLRYVDPADTDTNRWRWPIKDYWANMLCNATAISIYQAPGLEYNLDRCEKYVIGQAGNAIDAYIECIGEEQFLENLRTRQTRRNPKYTHMVNEYKHNSELRNTTLPALRPDLQ